MIAIVVLALTLLIGCEERAGPSVVNADRLVSRSVSYADPIDQRALEALLRKENIPFTAGKDESGKSFIKWAGENDAAVVAAQAKLFGPEPPEGRSISFGTMNAELIKWCEKNNIRVSTITNRGKEFVVWDEKDTSRVMSWPPFPREIWNKHFSPSNTTTETDARKSGSRGSP